MKRILPLLLILLAAVPTGALAATGSAPGGPFGFSARVTNPWFPLKPGTTLVYRGSKDGKQARDVVTPTRRVKTIGGVPCRVVRDRLYLNGRLAERTADYYTQDRQGNVWYYGEATAELNAHGHVVSREGSWQAGVDGAKPGVFMPAHPRVGQSFRQEYYKGHAEDHFRILDLHASVSTQYVSSQDALLTKEWTPLEPGVVDHKYYVRGIGTVLEQSVKGGNERLELVAVHRAR